MAKTVEVGLGLGSTDGNASGSGLGGSLKSSMEHEEGPIALPGSVGGLSEPFNGCSVEAGVRALGRRRSKSLVRLSLAMAVQEVLELLSRRSASYR
jgi:hypothetical protein